VDDAERHRRRRRCWERGTRQPLAERQLLWPGIYLYHGHAGAVSGYECCKSHDAGMRYSHYIVIGWLTP
jgi:hypothetical protein